ncbi:MAG: TerB family tellurite resistance protein [Proteobacteria bacterium]|nr:TerB family tellurite resistance protein [Pseudomonadota bacterium]
MSIADLSNVLSIFGGSEPDPEKQKELFKEVLLMTLARASSSDSNIQQIEVESIQGILKQETGEEFSVADVRKAARSDLYETVPLRKYLSSASRKLKSADRVTIIQTLAEVIRSDTEVSVLEIDFFNSVAEALKATPAELIGLAAG